jgi:hypothetical protein
MGEKGKVWDAFMVVFNITICLGGGKGMCLLGGGLRKRSDEAQVEAVLSASGCMISP